MDYRNFITALTLTLCAACGGGGGDSGPSSNANLLSLVLDAAPLAPAFNATTTSYTALVTGGTESTRVTAVSADSRSRLTINGTASASGVASAPIDLVIGATPISVVVTAQSGASRTYQVNVTRPVPNNNADLGDLALTVTELDQLFDPALSSYTATAGHLGASTRVIAEPDDPQADSLRLNGAAIAAGERSDYVALTVGVDTTLTIEVTAEDDNTTGTYQVAVSRSALNTLAQRAYVKATATGPDRFGAGLALAGNRLLVGAPREQSSATGIDGNNLDNSATQAGAAYLYKRIGGVWTVGNYLKAANTDNGDLFGWSVAATADQLAIGAPGEQSLGTNPQDNGGSAVGAVYVFDPDVAGAPVQRAYLKASNPDNNDRFGSVVASDGERILIGAPFEQSSATGIDGDGTDNTLSNAGAAYLFTRNVSGNWAQAAYLKASNTRAEQQFGSSLALSDRSIAVGARRENSGATGINGDQTSTSKPDSGAAYVFDQSASGIWSQSAYVKASNSDQDDDFGFSLDLDQDLLVVGAPGEDSASMNTPQDNTQLDSGAVYVFARNAAGNWSQEAYLKAPTPGFRDFFGTSVDLVGNMLAVGAQGERSNATGINGDDLNQNAVESGAVYLFERSAAGLWTQVAYVKASNTNARDLFGQSVALDGDTLAVGAPDEQSSAPGLNGNQADNGQTSAGAVYLFR